MALICISIIIFEWSFFLCAYWPSHFLFFELPTCISCPNFMGLFIFAYWFVGTFNRVDRLIFVSCMHGHYHHPDHGWSIFYCEVSIHPKNRCDVHTEGLKYDTTKPLYWTHTTSLVIKISTMLLKLSKCPFLFPVLTMPSNFFKSTLLGICYIQ